MEPVQSRHIYKYYEAADRFVRIRVCGAATLGLPAGPELDSAGYRRAVVEACVTECQLSDDGFVAGLCETRAAEAVEELFELVVSVNPSLDIRRVSLREPVREHEPKNALGPQEPVDLRRRARGLEARLKKRVFGQDAGVEAVARSVRRAAAGLAEERGPHASLLFVGATGTGKTELARALAAELFQESDALVRVDCSEFAEGHEYSKLIGSPPGYVGHDDGGFLTEAVRKRPQSVVLFDEIEKGHPRLHHLLLQVLEDGHLTDGRGSTTSFRECFVILTSNTGSRDIAEAADAIGFGRSELTGEASSELARLALRRTFRPEFLGRLDETIVFRSLDIGDVRRIAEAQLTDLAARTRRTGTRLTITPRVRDWIAEQGFDEGSGARGISHCIRREIEGPLADFVLAGSSGWIRIGIRRGKPVFEPEDESEAA